MKTLKTATILGALVLVATACSPRESGPDAKKAAAAPVAETPKRKPGLWKQTMLVEGIDGIQSVQLCLDGPSDAKLSWWGQQGFKQTCSKNEISQETDGSWRFSSVCEGAGVRTTNDGAAVGDFNTKYQLKAVSTTSGAPIPEMNGTRDVSIDAEWLGACPTGMRPGDMELPDGRRINMLKVAGQ